MKPLFSFLILCSLGFSYEPRDVLFTNKGIRDSFLVSKFSTMQDWAFVSKKNGIYFGGDMGGVGTGLGNGDSSYSAFVGKDGLFSEFTSNRYTVDLLAYFQYGQKEFTPESGNPKSNSFHYTENYFAFASVRQTLFNLIGLNLSFFYENYLIWDPNSISLLGPGTNAASLGLKGDSYYVEAYKTTVVFGKTLLQSNSLRFLPEVSIGSKLRFNIRALIDPSANSYDDIPFLNEELKYNIYHDAVLSFGHKHLSYSPSQEIISVKGLFLPVWEALFKMQRETLGNLDFDLILEYSLSDKRLRRFSFYHNLIFLRFGINYFSSSFLSQLTGASGAFGWDLALTIRGELFGTKRTIWEFGVYQNDPDRLEYSPYSLGAISGYIRAFTYF